MEALFEQICNLSISASWLILAVFAARFLLRKSPKKYICALWLLVGIRLVFPFSIESALSLVPAVNVSTISELAEEKQPPVQSETEQGDHLTVPAVNGGFQTNDFVADMTYSTTPEWEINEQLPAEEPTAKAKKLSEMEILCGIWISGVAVMLLYFGGSFWRLKRKLSDAVLFKDNIWQSEYVDSPFILGVFRPYIYIPYQLPEENLAYVLAHEKIHIGRRDHWTKVIAFLILSVYWFHPLVWLSYKYLCKDIEMACDEQVAERLNEEERKEYSKALLSCHGQRTWYHACPVGFGEVNVKERVVRVLGYRKPTVWVLISVIVLGVVIAVCFLTSARQEKPSGADGEQVNGRVDFGDLDGNSQIDYYIYETGEDENYHGQMTIYLNEEPIYTYRSEWEIFQAEAKYEDLDGDRRKELFVSWEPRVNSMPLMEYFVLDKTADGWKELEMIHGENVHDNAFPITMNYGAHQDLLEIGCEGSTVKIFYDLKVHYEKMLEEYAEHPDSDLYHSFQRILSGAEYEQGKEFGSVAPWGIHYIDTAVYHREIDGEYIDQTCLIATHGLQGPEGKQDFLGNLHIYFMYDDEGKVQILDMKLEEGEGGKINQDHLIAAFPEKQVWVYYDEWVDGIYKGIRVSRGIYQGSTYYEWYFDAHIADYYYAPEVSLLHGGEHLFIKFTQGTGTGVFETEAHILDLETMKEISIESPDEVISQALKTEEINHETGEIRFSIQGREMAEKLEHADEYLLSHLFEEIGFGSISKYGTKNDSLSYLTSLQVTAVETIGYLNLQYEYREGSYRVETIQYQQEEHEDQPVDEAGNQLRMAAYQEIIRRFQEEKLFPDGRFDIRFSGEIPKENGYQMADIDGDGRTELILNCSHTDSYGDAAFYIFEYDVDQRQLHEQFGAYPDITMYQNGIIMAKASHSHGRCDTSADVFWPYEVYQYEKETDTYELICQVDGWQKEVYPAGFPEEKDLDKDGMVFYLPNPDTYEPMAVMDGAEYEFWKESFIKNTWQLEFQFTSLSIQSNEAAASGDFDGNGQADRVTAESRRVNGSYQNVLKVTLDDGSVGEMVYEGRTAGQEDLLTLQTGKLRYSDKDCIVLEITDGRSNYGSTDLHVLSVAKASASVKLVEEATILDSGPADSEASKYRDTLLEAEGNSAISLVSAEELIQKADKLNVNAVQIWEYSEDVKMYLYWDGSRWDIEK